MSEKRAFTLGWLQWRDLFMLVALGGLMAMSPGSVRAEAITMGGTGSGLGLLTILGTAYKKEQPDFNFSVVPSLGSSGGIVAVGKDALQIAISNRKPKPNEMKAGLVTFPFACTPFVIVTQKKNIKGVTDQELTEIYAGRQTKWNDGTPIRLILRPAADSDNASLKAISSELSAAVDAALVRPGMVMALTDQEAADAGERLQGSLGTSTLVLLQTEGKKMIPLALNGVHPLTNQVPNSSYPHKKDLYLVYNSEKSSTSVKGFISFITSSKGRAMLPKLGAIPSEDAACSKSPRGTS